jgi:glutathione peroxidase
MSTNIYAFEAASIDGQPVRLEAYAGKPVLIVNVASKCGLTPQYEGLEALYRKYEHRGLAILGFPCDQFGHQEPGTESEIQEFCSLNYGVSFPLFSKIEVNGAGAHPLYKFLRSEKPAPVSAEEIKGNQLYQYLSTKLPQLLAGDSIRWNFTKFLIGRDGTVLRRFDPTVTPEEIEKEILPLLA